jgi:hypothetical protein
MYGKQCKLRYGLRLPSLVLQGMYGRRRGTCKHALKTSPPIKFKNKTPIFFTFSMKATELFKPQLPIITNVNMTAVRSWDGDWGPATGLYAYSSKHTNLLLRTFLWKDMETTWNISFNFPKFNANVDANTQILYTKSLNHTQKYVEQATPGNVSTSFNE